MHWTRVRTRAMNLFATLMTGILAVATACTPSSFIERGCEIAGGSGVAVHYKLDGPAVAFALRAKTEGYVGISFMPINQTAAIPADAVFGSALGAAVVVPMQINLETTFISSGVRLTNASVTKSGEYTTLAFARNLKDARFFLNPRALRFRVASGAFDALAFENSSTLVTADLVEGLPAAEPVEAPKQPVAAPNEPAAPPPATVPVAVGVPRTSSGSIGLTTSYAVAFAIAGVLAST